MTGVGGGSLDDAVANEPLFERASERKHSVYRSAYAAGDQGLAVAS